MPALPQTALPPKRGKFVVPDHTRGAHPTTSGRIVGVPVSGTYCTMRVREDVGGGGRLHLEWQAREPAVQQVLERDELAAHIALRHEFGLLHQVVIRARSGVMPHARVIHNRCL